MDDDATAIDTMRDVDAWEPQLRNGERYHVWHFVTIYHLASGDTGVTHKVYVMRCERCGQLWRVPKMYTSENQRAARAFEKAQKEPRR